jgi:HAD superfamily hydrolase (TIGR01509 family)
MFWNRLDQGVPLLPGVQDTLTDLAPRFSLAIVTGASRRHFDRVHASTGITHFFGTVVTRDDYDCDKPHPQAYLTAMQKLSVEPDDCLAVEDSPRGAAAAVAAGIRCCVIPTGLTDLGLCPLECTILNDVRQLIQFTRREGNARR